MQTIIHTHCQVATTDSQTVGNYFLSPKYLQTKKLLVAITQ